MQKITKLGVINFVDYPQQEIDVHGNTVVIKADNGTGKTLLMTALYPALFTLELQKSLNMGQKQDRKINNIINNEPTYIYGHMYINNEPKTIVTAYVKPTSTITKRAYIINGHNVQFLNNQNEPLPLHEFERTNNIVESFSSIKSYQEYVARVIYNTSLDNFKMRIQISHKIASPSVITAKDNTYNMEDLLDQVKEVLPSLTNDDAFNQQLTSYGEQLIKANDEQNKIYKMRQEQAAIAKERHLLSQTNQKAISELNAILADMEQKSNQNQQKLDNLDEEIQSLEAQIEQNENEKLEIEDDLAQTNQKKQFIQSHLQNLNIDGQIQALETEIRYLSDTKSATKKELSDTSNRLSKTENNIAKLSNQLDMCEKALNKTPQPELPFDINEWSEIEKAFETNENYIKESQQLAIQRNEKENDIARQIELIEKTKRELQKLIATVQTQWNITDSDTNDQMHQLANDLTQKHASLLSEKDLLAQETNNHINELTQLQNQTEPHTSFVATNAQPLYTQIDFRENISEDEQRRIENLMHKAGLIELLVTADSITEGSILCKNN